MKDIQATTDKIGFAIIGCGLVSAFHANAIRAIPSAKLIGFMDIRKDRAQQRAEQFDSTAFTNLRAILDHKEIQVINVCTPNGLHEPIVLEAAQAGKHVLVEKPPEITLERMDKMITACQKAGVEMVPVLQTRFRPAVAELRRAVKHGRLGRLFIGDVYMKWYRSGAYYQRDKWRGTRDIEGGIMMQLAFHYIDLLRWLLGPVKQVFARTARLRHHNIETEDSAFVIIEFINGAIGVLEASTAVIPGIDVRLEIHGDRGSIRLKGECIQQWYIDGQEDETLKKNLSHKGKTAAGGEADFDWQDHKALIMDFIDALRNGRPPAVTAIDGRNALEIVLAIYRSAKIGKPVALPIT
ncbi:MAG: gfo/Idh/MocA family oxidoreductase [Calditrichaeota bacterium]|nr:MAG: gfo/Idh/MocA family oxidoreductase [Calditrichota bacterium]